MIKIHNRFHYSHSRLKLLPLSPCLEHPSHGCPLLPLLHNCHPLSLKQVTACMMLINCTAAEINLSARLNKRFQHPTSCGSTSSVLRSWRFGICSWSQRCPPQLKLSKYLANIDGFDQTLTHTCKGLYLVLMAKSLSLGPCPPTGALDAPRCSWDGARGWGNSVGRGVYGGIVEKVNLFCHQDPIGVASDISILNL